MTTKDKIIQIFTEIIEEAEHIDCNFIFNNFNNLIEQPIEDLSDEDVLQILIQIQYDTIH